jgi:hypothetical protein
MIFSRLHVYEYNLYSFLSISDRRNKWQIKNAETPLLELVPTPGCSKASVVNNYEDNSWAFVVITCLFA